MVKSKAKQRFHMILLSFIKEPWDVISRAMQKVNHIGVTVDMVLLRTRDRKIAEQKNYEFFRKMEGDTRDYKKNPM